MSDLTETENESEATDIGSEIYIIGSEKPNNISMYKTWLSENFKEKTSNAEKMYYESVLSKVKTDFEKSSFFVQLTDNLKKYNDEYFVKTNYNLFTTNSPSESKPEIVVKPYESFILKTFRYNIINNDCWPKEPLDGWILPSKSFNRINDLVRMLIVVKYLDGVEFLVEKIKSLDSDCKVEFKAKEEGYYAAHIYINRTFEIPELDWNTRKEKFLVEIQITTQLQEVIRKLLHKHYEENRKKLKTGIESTKWQWNYKCDEFSSNYMGHILHYIEGMIMDIRDKQDEAKKNVCQRDDHYE